MTITIHHLSKSFKGNIIFTDINVELKAGKVYGLIGKNGTGKTTLLRLLSGLDKPDNQPYLNLYPELYSPIGIHIESAKLYPFFTGKQNIDFFVSDINTFYFDVDYLIKVFKLEKFIHKKVKHYSLGTKQKISLIIAILMSKKMLLLDEPTNGLDEDSIDTFKMLLSELSDKHKVTIMISTHDLEELKSLFDEVLLIKNGLLEKVEVDNENKTSENYFVYQASQSTKKKISEG